MAIKNLGNGNVELEVRIQKSEMDDFLECSRGVVRLEIAAVSESPFPFIFTKLDNGYTPLILDKQGNKRQSALEEKFYDLVTAPLDEMDCKVYVSFILHEHILDKYAGLKEKCHSPTYSELIRRSLKVWIEAYKIVKGNVLLLVHPDEEEFVCLSFVEDKRFVAGVYTEKK